MAGSGEKRSAGLPPEVLVRAVAEATSPISVADARQPDLPLVYVNEAFERVTGFASAEVLGRNCRLVQGPHREQEGREPLRVALAQRRPVRVRMLNRRPDGQDWWNELHLSFARDEAGVVTHVLGLQHDVTEQVLAERDLQQLAYQDPLTGLPNRRQLEQHLDLAVARAARAGTAVALLSLDLNGFKAVNDRLGHAAGDDVLRHLGGRLRHAVRSTDLVARLGGDEFVVLLADLPGPQAQQATAAVAAQIQDSLAAPLPLSDALLSLTVSLGAAVYPTDATTAQDLMRLADRAMYRHKADTTGPAPGDP